MITKLGDLTMGRQRRIKNGSERLIKTIQLFSVSNQFAKGALGTGRITRFHQRLNAGGAAVRFLVVRHISTSIINSCVAIPRRAFSGEFVTA
jgi:hypothetical protein